MKRNCHFIMVYFQDNNPGSRERVRLIFLKLDCVTAFSTEPFFCSLFLIVHINYWV